MRDPKYGIERRTENVKQRRVEQDGQGGVLRVVAVGIACRVVQRQITQQVHHEHTVERVARRIAPVEGATVWSLQKQQAHG